MRIHLAQAYASAVDPTPHVLSVAAMFGLGLDQHRAIPVVPPCDIDLHPGHILFITGPSGSGKSSILALLRQHLRKQSDTRWWDIADLPAPADAPLVDAFPDLPLAQTLRLLAQVGLGDAFVMLRRPSQLSDGQRYRLRLAQTLTLALPPDNQTQPSADLPAKQPEPCGSALNGIPGVVLADEFGAALDRVTAKVIARNIRKLATRTGLCFALATTHDDLLESLDPDVLIYKGFGSEMTVAVKPQVNGP